MMDIPKNNAEWLVEIKAMYTKALNDLMGGILQTHEKQSLYLVAPLYAASNRGIEDKSLIHEMCEHIKENAEKDFSCDGESINNYKFHFVISYIHSHVPVELLQELEADKVMDYVNNKWNLFD